MEATTDGLGKYEFPEPAPGAYAVTVEAQGFARGTATVVVRSGEVTRSDFQLALPGMAEHVEVTAASRYDRSLEGLPLSATVIPRDEILASAGRSIEERLRGVASVQLPFDNSDVAFPLNPSIAMRGIGVGDTATRSLVLLDGLPLNGAFFGNVFWNRAPDETVERVEVVRGASSSLFGSFAMGGVVNLVSHVDDRRQFVADARYGENARFEGSAQYADVAKGGDVSFVLNGNYYRTDGFYRVPEEERTPVDERLGGSLGNLQGRVNVKFSEKARGFLRAGYNDQHREGGYPLQQTDIQVPDVAGGLDVQLGAGLLGLRAFYAHEDFRIDNVRVVDDETTFVSNRHHTRSNDAGLSAQWSRGFAGRLAHVTAGTDLRLIDGSNDQDVFNTPEELAATVLGEGKQSSLGVFGEVSLRPTSRFEVLASLRYDHFRDSDGRIVTDAVPVDYPERTFDVASPRVALRYELAQALALRGAYYEGFRAPTLAERYRSFESPTFRGLSNPGLSEERLRGGDVGVDLHFGRFEGQVNGFHNQLRDFVGSAEAESPDDKFTVMNSNVAKIRSRGVEVIANLKLTDALRLTANYTFTDAEVVEGELLGNKVEGAPRNMAALAVSYLPPSGLSVNVRGRFVGESFQDITNEAFMDSHFIVDAFASYRARKNVEILLVAENLFDEKYIADGFGQSLGAPRQVSGGIRVRF